MEFNEILKREDTFRYMMLDRMRTDCEYYLGNGNRHPKNLWAGDEVKQIAYMKALWNSFGESGKPEWLSYAKILEYEQQMGIKAILVEMDYKGFFKRFALTPEEFEKEFPDTFKTFEPITESNSDTLRPMVHIWFAPCVVGDSNWERHFTDMLWGLSEGDLQRIENGNIESLPYISHEEMQSLKGYLSEDLVLSAIQTAAASVVQKYDWRMPKYDSSFYDSYTEYESDCLDVGNERRSGICGEVIQHLRAARIIEDHDESYHEIIDEEVWDEITNHIVRNMSKDVPFIIESFKPGQKFLELDTQKTIELTKKVSSDIWQFRVYDSNHSYLYDTTVTQTRLAKDVIAGYIVSKTDIGKKMGIDNQIQAAASKVEKNPGASKEKVKDQPFEI